MSLISYARNFEDVLLWRALRHIEAGFYVDAGAGDPQRDSVTLAFYQRGWRGLNVEPAADTLLRLRQARPADINVGAAVAAAAGSALLYCRTDAAASTLEPARAQAWRAAGHEVMQREVPLQTLDALCAQHVASDIHFMHIAVDGAETAALAGLELRRWRPWLLLVRGGAAFADPAETAASAEPLWQAGVLAQGYTLALDDGRSRYYVAQEQAALLAALRLPPSPADDFMLCEDHAYAYPLTEWRTRTAAAEAEAAESRTWALAHTEEWKQKYSRIEQYEQTQAEHVQTLQVQTEALARQGATMSEQAQSLQSQYATLQTQHASLDAQRLLLAAQAETLALQKHSLGQQAHALQQQTDRARQVEQDLIHARWSADHAAVLTEQQRQDTEQQRLRAEHAEAVVAGITRSLSWRVTRPLRAAKDGARAARRLLRRVAGAAKRAVRGLRTLSRRALKSTLLRAMRFITARPALSYFVRRNVARFPPLVALLRGVALRSQSQPLPAASDAPAAAAELLHLPATARRVFDDLQRARQQQAQT
ncbi:FkbM family methyltransferase [Rugamonas sp.]|uniref:FkbM family methyltransferase n=1 Tax=Rugamonas sp. TaxID=1926287 RepID=UPI0025E6439D|nr:FkbM family methyltransferase [Rugamonas sp.]